MEKEKYSAANEPSNDRIAESDKSKQPIPKEFIDWMEGE